MIRVVMSMLCAVGLAVAVSNANAAALVDEGFNNFQLGSRPAGWSFINCNANTDVYSLAGFYGRAAPSVKLDNNGDIIISKTFTEGSGLLLTFWLRGSYAATSSHLLVEEYYNSGTTWGAVTDIYSIHNDAGLTYGAFLLRSTSRNVKFSWKDNGGNLALDDVIIYGGGTTPTASPRIATPTPQPGIPTPTPTAVPVSILIDSGDYNGDGTSDIAVFRGSSGMWSVRNFTRAYFGNSADRLVPADYNGDGTTDVAIFRGSSGMWAVRDLTRFYLGLAGDAPVPGDYLGNGTAEGGLFRASGGLWAIRNVTRAYFGSTGDSTVPGYYNLDDAKDIAVFRGSTGMWSVRNVSRFYFGLATDKLVPGDYNGVGNWEGGIFRPSTGMWSIRNVSRFYLGISTDAPVTADYNGDGVDDGGIFRDSNGMWAVKNLTRAYFGATGDIPVTR